MKHLSSATVILLLFALFSSALRAEYVFRKDGAIVKGAIVRDEAKSIDVRTSSGTMEKVSRDDIIRIVYTELYLGKVYARLTSGEVIEGYQVYENRDYFFFRKDLNKPEEITLPRNKVLFIVRTNPTDLVGEADTGNITVSWSAPFRPAKFYRVFMRDAKAGDGKFTLVDETKDVSLQIKKMKKSWSYEIYATAVNDAGEESLPSEKIIVKTRPEAPENLTIKDERSSDNKTAALTFSWDLVNDTQSRVVTYALYQLVDKKRTLVGKSADGTFRLEGVPATGKHRFAVVSVNDDRTESADLQGIWDAGLQPILRLTGSYIVPLGEMKTLARSGYAFSLYGGLSARYFDAGLETGIWSFSCTSDIESMLTVPLYASVNVPYTLRGSLALRPLFKAGICFDYIKYIRREPSAPLVKKIRSEWSADPSCAFGAMLEWMPNEYMRLYAGSEYTLVAQKTLMQSLSFEVGAGAQF